MATDADKVAQDDERFLRAYPNAVEAGKWEEVARLLSGKCRDLERKATAANKANDALVAALEETRKWLPFGGGLTAQERAIHKRVAAALALARGEG